MNDIKSISCSEAIKKLSEGAVLIDVRDQSEIKKCAFDLKKVIEIPAFQFQKRLQDFPNDSMIILADTENEKSKRAAVTLLNNGFTEVVYLEGGMKEWESKGFPVFKSTDYLSSYSKCGCCG
ncbi:MAG: rhodanese-like domain-containing protein [Bacteroidota bacterium]